MIRKLVIVAFLLFPFSALAQDPAPDENYARFVIPFNSDVTGAFGTKWHFEGWLYNPGPDYVRFFTADTACGGMCPGPPGRPSIPPGTQQYFLIGHPGLQHGGYIVHIDPDAAPKVEIRVVMHLVTGGEEQAVEIPIVPEANFRPDPVELLMIPTAPRQRTTIRIYELFSTAGALTTVRVYSGLSTFGVPPIPVAERGIAITPTDYDPPYSLPVYTGYAEISLSELLPDDFPDGLVRVEVTPANAEASRLWAFASITDNLTQHVTLVTPQLRAIYRPRTP